MIIVCPEGFDRIEFATGKLDQTARNFDVPTDFFIQRCELREIRKAERTRYRRAWEARRIAERRAAAADRERQLQAERERQRKWLEAHPWGINRTIPHGNGIYDSGEHYEYA